VACTNKGRELERYEKTNVGMMKGEKRKDKLVNGAKSKDHRMKR